MNTPALVQTALFILLTAQALATAVPDTVSFETEDGVVIVGSWYAADAMKSPGLLLLHMNRGDRSQWESFAETARGGGYHVLSIDFRGHGESTETREDPLIFAALDNADYAKMVMDVDAAVAWMGQQQHLEPRQIGIIGASIGANVAVQYMADHERLACIVMVSPGLNYRGMLTEPATAACSDRAVLLVAAEDDNYSAVSVRQLVELGGDIFESLMYESGGHGIYLLESHADFADRLLSFTDKFLKQPDTDR